MRVILCLGLILSAAACSTVSDQLSLEKEAPDEFAIRKNAPLEVNQALEQTYLPKPGDRPMRRKDVTESLLFKKNTLQAPRVQSRPLSPIEKQLLEQTNASTVSPNIRDIVDQEFEAKPDNQSAVDKLLRRNKKTGKTIDPDVEKTRLETGAEPE